jgi:fatty-acid desaturase
MVVLREGRKTQSITGVSDSMTDKERKTDSDLPRRPILWANVLFLTLTPLAAAIAVPWYILSFGVTWVEIVACVAMWLLTGLSVTAGPPVCTPST